MKARATTTITAKAAATAPTVDAWSRVPGDALPRVVHECSRIGTNGGRPLTVRVRFAALRLEEHQARLG